MQTDCVIIGGGISGLTAAHELIRAGVAVMLLESNEFGGVIQSRQVDGFTLELGANTLVLTPELSALLNQLGLSEFICKPVLDPYEQHVWFRGAPHAVPKGPRALFASQLLTFSEKMRAAYGLFFAPSTKEIFAEQSIAAFFSTLVGGPVAKNIIAPSLRGIFGGDSTQLIASAVFPELYSHIASGKSLLSYVRARRTLGRRSIFCLKGGNHLLCASLVQAVSERAKVLREAALEVQKVPSGFEVRTEGRVVSTRAVLVATSGASSANYLATLDREHVAHIALHRYAPVIVCHLAADSSARPLPRSFGVLFPAENDNPLLGIMFNSQLFPHVAPAGQQLITVCLGGIGNESLLDDDDDALAARAVSSLEGTIRVGASRVLKITRWPRAISQYDLAHSQLRKAQLRLETSFRGLYFLGADYGGVGVPSRVKHALGIAHTVTTLLSPATTFAREVLPN